MPDREPNPKPGSGLHSAWIGAAFGALVELPALVAAFLSAGMGYGHYAAARILFPLPMLMTRVEGQIGWVSGGLALLQFPLYGALLGRIRRERTPGAATLLAVLHLVAAITCFAGALPDFS